MRFFCVACLKRADLHPELSLCPPCAAELSDLQTSEARRHGAVYEYRDLAREMILRVKIGGDHAALSTLKSIAASSFSNMSVQDRGFPNTRVRLMPAASSLWGRLRGRFDLADALARAIAKRHGLSVQKTPGELYWRIQKSSLQTRTSRLDTLTSVPVPTIWDITGIGEQTVRDVVLVDDITTTGATYHRHAEVLARSPPKMRLYMWTLAWTPTTCDSLNLHRA
jgi:predicted amidophosphoribosyltransferase